MEVNNQPLVSIIITTYKRHDYLYRAICSVINQTYKNIELLIVDDNDSNSEFSKQVKDLVEEFRKNDDRIVYLPMGKNSGACQARNAGFLHSHGDYVDFLDDDDEFHPEKIQLQLEKFKNCDPNIGMIGCFAKIKNDKGEIIQYDRNRIKGDVFFENLCHSICQTSLPLIRRDIFEESGGFESIVSSQEHLMFARVLAVCPYYDYVDKELVYIYHHNGERISNGSQKPQGAIELSERFKRYYHKLDSNQIMELESCMNANIINAYVMVNQRKNALMYFLKRKNLKKRVAKEDFKLLFGIIFGIKAKQFLHRVLLSKRV